MDVNENSDDPAKTIDPVQTVVVVPVWAGNVSLVELVTSHVALASLIFAATVLYYYGQAADF